MKRKVIENGEGHVEEKDQNGALVNQLDTGFRLGDVTWVKHRGRSWWPAQIVDENSVCRRSKPRRKRSDDVLVRLYGTYEYLFVDPKANLVEFSNVLKRHKGSHREIIQEALKQGFKTKGGRSKDKESEDEDMAVDDNGSGHGEVVTPQKVVESARKKKVMQDLGLIAPSGSPFHKNGQTLTVVQ